MSQNVTINGKKFVPSAELARQFGYSLDYISRLAREGKVDATRIGRQWFVEAASLKHFVENITQQKIESRKELRRKRKEELKHYNQPLPTEHKAVVSHTHNIASEKKVLPRKKGSDVLAVSSALLGTILVLTAGILCAAAYDPVAVVTLLKNRDIAIVRSNYELDRSIPAGALGSVTRTESEIETSDKSVNTNHEGIIVFDEPQSTENLDRVRGSFSDETEITFEGSDTGLITPVFRHQTGDAYQFLLVPINEAS